MECGTVFLMHRNSLKQKEISEKYMSLLLLTSTQIEKNHHPKVMVVKMPSFTEFSFVQVSFHRFVRFV